MTLLPPDVFMNRANNVILQTLEFPVQDLFETSCNGFLSLWPYPAGTKSMCFFLNSFVFLIVIKLYKLGGKCCY